MNFENAREIILKKFPLLMVRSCLDFGDFFLFSLSPIYIKEEDSYDTGTIFPIVYKKTGKISEYNITSDLSLFERAKKIY